MRARPTTVIAVVGLGLAGVVATAGSATAAPSHVRAPRIANTVQTVYFHQKAGGGYENSTEIDFKTTTFKDPAFGDSGTFLNKGKKLTFTVTKTTKNSQDDGCIFKGKYSAATTYYQGTYTCPGGLTDSFAVTTAGR